MAVAFFAGDQFLRCRALSTLRLLLVVSVISACNIQGMTRYMVGVRHMSLSPWNDGSDPDQVTGLHRDDWLVGHRKIPAWQMAKLPRYRREGAVEVRPFTAKKRLW